MGWWCVGRVLIGNLFVWFWIKIRQRKKLYIPYTGLPEAKLPKTEFTYKNSHSVKTASLMVAVSLEETQAVAEWGAASPWDGHGSQKVIMFPLKLQHAHVINRILFCCLKHRCLLFTPAVVLSVPTTEHIVGCVVCVTGAGKKKVKRNSRK